MPHVYRKRRTSSWEATKAAPKASREAAPNPTLAYNFLCLSILLTYSFLPAPVLFFPLPSLSSLTGSGSAASGSISNDGSVYFPSLGAEISSSTAGGVKGVLLSVGGVVASGVGVWVGVGVDWRTSGVNVDGSEVSGGGAGGASAGDGWDDEVGFGFEVPAGFADDRILIWRAGDVEIWRAGALDSSLADAVAVLNILTLVYNIWCWILLEMMMDLRMTEFRISVAAFGPASS
jgi:hypothetical protein